MYEPATNGLAAGCQRLCAERVSRARLASIDALFEREEFEALSVDRRTDVGAPGLGKLHTGFLFGICEVCLFQVLMDIIQQAEISRYLVALFFAVIDSLVHHDEQEVGDLLGQLWWQESAVPPQDHMGTGRLEQGGICNFANLIDRIVRRAVYPIRTPGLVSRKLPTPAHSHINQMLPKLALLYLHR